MGCLRGYMHPPSREVARNPPNAGTVDEDHNDKDRDTKREFQEVEGCGNQFDRQLGQRVLWEHAVLILPNLGRQKKAVELSAVCVDASSASIRLFHEPFVDMPGR